MKKVLFNMCLYSVMIVFYSCGIGQESVVTEFNQFGNSVKLDSSVLGQIPVFSFGDNFVFNDFMHIHNEAVLGGKLSENKLTLSENVLNIGHGHNEFQDASFIKGNGNTMYLMNCQGGIPKSVTRVTQVKGISDLKDTNKWETYRLNNLPAFYNLSQYNAYISDSTLLVLGAPATNMGHIMSVLDFKNQKVQPLDFWPEDNVECDSIAKFMLYAQYAKIMGNGNGRYAYCFSGERYLFVFSIEDSHVNVIKKLYENYPIYEGDGMNTRTKSYRPEGLSSCGSRENLYVLLKDSDADGEKLDRYLPPLYGNTVEVYDWDGIKQKTIHLDNYGTKIMVSDDNKTLYLFVLDDESGNYKTWTYDIDSLK